METMKETNDWENNSINCEIATRLSKMWEIKWESAYRNKSSPNIFTYMGREMGVWVKVVWCEVWDIPDDDDYVHTVSLWDVAICDDFRKVLQDLQKEKWINIEILDYISISDCTALLWLDSKIPTMDEMIDDYGIKFKIWAHDIIRDEAKKFSMNWLAFYSIIVSSNWKFYLKATNQHLKDMIINKDKNFYYEIVRVITRLKEDLPLKLKEYAEREREMDEKEKNEKQENINNLKNNI